MNQFLYRQLSFCFTLIALSFSSLTATATHIIGGEIIARRHDPQSLTFEIILRGYTNSGSGVGFGSNGRLDLGDGTVVEFNNDNSNVTSTRLSEEVWVNELKVKHTYAAAGNYLLSFIESNRNEGAINFDNAANTAFFVETLLKIDPLLGVNNSPILLRPPKESAYLGKTYHHQPGAIDADGDSLAFKLVQPKADKNISVTNYRFPQRSFPQGDPRNGAKELGGEPDFTINPYTGDITWDAPGTAGEYTVAFAVEEWRKKNGQYYLMGYVIRDMLIVVQDADPGVFPQLSYPFPSSQLSPASGEVLNWTITATAPTPSDSVVLELWGDFLTRTDAVISAKQVRAIGEASITISWTGEEDLKQHYQLIASAYDPAQPQFTRNRSTFIYYDPSSPLGLYNPKVSAATVYPNPLSESSFFISIPEAAGKEVRLQVYDVRGRLIQQQTFSAFKNQQPVVLGSAKQGLYLVHAYCQGRVFRSKLIVQ